MGAKVEAVGKGQIMEAWTADSRSKHRLRVVCEALCPLIILCVFV